MYKWSKEFLVAYQQLQVAWFSNSSEVVLNVFDGSSEITRSERTVIRHISFFEQ